MMSVAFAAVGPMVAFANAVTSVKGTRAVFGALDNMAIAGFNVLALLSGHWLLALADFGDSQGLQPPLASQRQLQEAAETGHF